MTLVLLIAIARVQSVVGNSSVHAYGCGRHPVAPRSMVAIALYHSNSASGPRTGCRFGLLKASFRIRRSSQYYSEGPLAEFWTGSTQGSVVSTIFAVAGFTIATVWRVGGRHIVRYA